MLLINSQTQTYREIEQSNGNAATLCLIYKNTKAIHPHVKRIIPSTHQELLLSPQRMKIFTPRRGYFHFRRNQPSLFVLDVHVVLFAGFYLLGGQDQALFSAQH